MAQQSLASPVKPWWNPASRCVVFLLAASSIACLLLDFYGLCPMRLFTLLFFLPAMFVLLALACLDRLRGNGDLWVGVFIGLTGCLLAAIGYYLFRLPFVFAREWGLSSLISPMPL